MSNCGLQVCRFAGLQVCRLTMSTFWASYRTVIVPYGSTFVRKYFRTFEGTRTVRVQLYTYTY
jgi:hypothetical protein